MLGAAWTAWRADPESPAAAAATMVGVAFCVVAPEYPWYALLLVALLAAADRPRWLAVAAAAWPAYLAGALHWDYTATQAIGYGVAALLVAAAAARGLPGRPRPGAAAGYPAASAVNLARRSSDSRWPG